MKQILVVLFFPLFMPLTSWGQEAWEVMDSCEKDMPSSSTQASCSFFQDEDEEEYDYKEKTMQIKRNEDDNQYNVTVGAPIVTTRPFSKSEAIYMKGHVQILEGDKIAKIGYMGYNPGDEVERHVEVWMQKTESGVYRVGGGFEPVDNMTKVFEGDIVIKSGGQPGNWIQLVDITLDEPFTYNDGGVRITILSYGDASDHDVYFARSNNNIKNTAMYSTSDQMEDVSNSPQSDLSPQLRYTIATKVEYLTGQVNDQDGNPIAGAEVTLTSCKWEQNEYKGMTDEEGHYRVRASEGRNTFLPSAKAPGYIPYEEVGLNYTFSKEYDFWSLLFEDKKMDFTLFNALDFKVGVVGTIILPVEPDATLGNYYRLDHRDDKVLVFEREPNPQANVPYLLMVNEDCRVDISGMDLSGKPGQTTLDKIWFKGSYENTDMVITTNQDIYFFDHTADCENGRIGGCRAYILVDLLYGPFYYKLQETNGVEQLILAPKGDEAERYDLQGGRLPSGIIPHGIYISNGKKHIGR